jgi:hypothetical protein
VTASPLSPPATHISSLFSSRPVPAPLLYPVRACHRRDSLTSTPNKATCVLSHWSPLYVPAAHAFWRQLGHSSAGPAPALPPVLAPICRHSEASPLPLRQPLSEKNHHPNQYVLLACRPRLPNPVALAYYTHHRLATHRCAAYPVCQTAVPTTPF